MATTTTKQEHTHTKHLWNKILNTQEASWRNLKKRLTHFLARLQSPTISTKQHVTSLPPIRVHMVVIVVEVVVAVVVGVVVMAVTMMVVVVMVVRVAMDEQMAISEWPAQGCLSLTPSPVAKCQDLPSGDLLGTSAGTASDSTPRIHWEIQSSFAGRV